MTQDPFQDPFQNRISQDPISLPGRRGASRLILGGAAAACVLGSGLGFVARPEPERIAAPARAPADAAPAPPALQIVVDDTPAPLGPPLEVLPVGPTQTTPDGATPRRIALPPTPLAVVKVDVPLVEETRPASRRAPVAAPPAAEPPRPPAAKPAAKRPGAPVAAKRERSRRAEAARPERPAQRQAVRKSEPLAPARATRAGPAEARRKSSEPAGSVRVASERATHPHAAGKPVGRASAPKPAALRGAGPLRVARAQTCQDGCRDGAMTARERQLRKAYREAEAAGVPTGALRRREARWVQVRAAAAREAPWAVEDVYEAQISELNDLARDARDN